MGSLGDCSSLFAKLSEGQKTNKALLNWTGGSDEGQHKGKND
jgi:hypothetical protein